MSIPYSEEKIIYFIIRLFCFFFKVTLSNPDHKAFCFFFPCKYPPKAKQESAIDSI